MTGGALLFGGEMHPRPQIAIFPYSAAEEAPVRPPPRYLLGNAVLPRAMWANGGEQADEIIKSIFIS
jgi:hypothetical protein